jgi:Skp family chaperone for outer membrane proteins
MNPIPAAAALRRGILIGAGCLLAGLTSAALHAQPSKTAPQATHVAIVDIVKVKEGLAETKDAEAKLQAIAKEYDQRLQDIKKEIDKIDANLDTMKDKKETAEFRSLAGERAVKQAQGKALGDVLTELMAEQNGAIVRPMYLKMVETIDRIAKADGWDLVLRDDRGIVPPAVNADGRPITAREVVLITTQRSVLAASDTIDITQAVINRMNNDYKAAPTKKEKVNP